MMSGTELSQFLKLFLPTLGYNINVLRQSACFLGNPATVHKFASLFNCTPVGRALNAVMDPT